MKKKIIITALIVAVGLSAAFARKGARFLRYLRAQFRQDTTSRNHLFSLSKPKIIIEKSKRILSLYDGDTLVKSYRAGLGFAPVGVKKREGDSKTPEGAYYISTKNPNSRFYLSLGLSYPNAADASAGLARGAISQGEHDKIVAAITDGETPLWKTALGGEIFIHGHGSANDWTLGCIALDDADIEELYNSLREGTPVEILP